MDLFLWVNEVVRKPRAVMQSLQFWISSLWTTSFVPDFPGYILEADRTRKKDE
jgi:hypothetical protein